MRRATDPDRALAGASPRDALLLGLLHGPAELVPISSSGIVTLVPWLIGLPYARLDSSKRKTIEVALHAGTAAALLVAPPRSSVPVAKGRRAAVLATLTLSPTAAIGFAARGPIRRILGTPTTTAAGMLVGSIALILSERLGGTRQADSQTASDALVIGVAQSVALWPGLSRSTAVITAARALGFTRGSAVRVARSGVIPVSGAAATLEGAEAWRAGELRASGPAVIVAAGSAFASTLVARPLATKLEQGGSLTPWALMRAALAILTLQRIRVRRKDDGR